MKAPVCDDVHFARRSVVLRPELTAMHVTLGADGMATAVGYGTTARTAAFVREVLAPKDQVALRRQLSSVHVEQHVRFLEVTLEDVERVSRVEGARFAAVLAKCKAAALRPKMTAKAKMAAVYRATEEVS